jgi:hypothetical protein
MFDKSSLFDFYYIRFTAVEIVVGSPFSDPTIEPLPVSFSARGTVSGLHSGLVKNVAT